MNQGFILRAVVKRWQGWASIPTFVNSEGFVPGEAICATQEGDSLRFRGLCSHVWCRSIACSGAELQARAGPSAGCWAAEDGQPSPHLPCGSLCHLSSHHEETGKLSHGAQEPWPGKVLDSCAGDWPPLRRGQQLERGLPWEARMGTYTALQAKQRNLHFLFLLMHKNMT